MLFQQTWPFFQRNIYFFTGKNLQERKMNQAQSVKVYKKWMTNIRNNQEQLTHISILTQKLISSFKIYLQTSNYENLFKISNNKK